MLRIVLAQPGSTDFDDQGRIKGSLDIPLSVNGTAQVARTVETMLGVEAVRPGHDLAALEGFETALDRHLSATDIRLKSEKRGAIVARWYRSFLEGKEISLDDVHTWIELLRE